MVPTPLSVLVVVAAVVLLLPLPVVVSALFPVMGVPVMAVPPMVLPVLCVPRPLPRVAVSLLLTLAVFRQGRRFPRGFRVALGEL